MNPSSSLQKLVIRAFFLLMTFEGFVTLLSIVSDPSEIQNTVFLNLSMERMILSALLMAVLLPLAWMSGLALFSSSWIRKWFASGTSSLIPESIAHFANGQWFRLALDFYFFTFLRIICCQTWNATHNFSKGTSPADLGCPDGSSDSSFFANFISI
jgi:hypothetical protein